ncbi:DUF4097 family beta strand repeat-containing protein [Kutzneria kofuensis]|uniref:DUF4097 and DUF4098 domain-containing protein YvlB n=1 Tax=Kutzneria kofuensis TaxID=103725 RepID=A0A7W9NHX9_9PSEU|nr:DUF4097 family beta strand repeat-containing protein [Kutzneria kofuensis]MBB5892701.1 DUF4097 and DUF4098 domain-containing protein YvlB [Kutzneria kofuensis]
MPTFATPEPISVTVELSVGNVQVVAGDRTDTVVDVRPSTPSDKSDVEAAQRVRVDYANGALQVIGPKGRMFDFSNKTRSVDVTIELPAGSSVHGEVSVGDLHGTGRLGRCEFKTSAGNVRLERTGALVLRTSTGHITAGDVAGNAEVHTSSGRVRIGAVEGSLEVKNSNGDTEIGAADGDVRVRASNGAITIERAGGSVDAKTSNGSIRLGEVARGSISLSTAMGDVEVGIAAGTAAWLDVNTSFGQVRNELDDAVRPEDSDETVEVRANTSFGAITIHRA